MAIGPRWMRSSIFAAVLVVGALLAGCSESSSSKSEESKAEQKASEEKGSETTDDGLPAPEDKVHVKSPDEDETMRFVEVTPERIQKGKKAYSACVACHGPEAKGKIGIAPRLQSKTFLQAASDRFLFETIEQGRPGTTMIAWGENLSDDEIKSIIAYIRSLQPTDPADLDNSPLAGNPEKGEEIFQICARCHGNHGGGYQEAAPGTGIALKGFLSAASNGFLRYVIANGKSQTPMRAFDDDARMAVADLSDKEIEHVIAFMRHNAW